MPCQVAGNLPIQRRPGGTADRLCTEEVGGVPGAAWRRGGVARMAVRGADWRPIGTHFDSATFGGVRRSGRVRPATPFVCKAVYLSLPRMDARPVWTKERPGVSEGSGNDLSQAERR